MGAQKGSPQISVPLHVSASHLAFACSQQISLVSLGERIYDQCKRQIVTVVSMYGVAFEHDKVQTYKCKNFHYKGV